MELPGGRPDADGARCADATRMGDSSPVDAGSYDQSVPPAAGYGVDDTLERTPIPPGSATPGSYTPELPLRMVSFDDPAAGSLAEVDVVVISHS